MATLSSFIGPFMGSSVNVALPTIGREMSMGTVLLGWVNTSYLLAAAAFVVPFGRLGDIYGRKRIYIMGTILFGAASVLLANSESSLHIILFRVLQGFGSSMVAATIIPILISVYPLNQRGRALGLSVAAVYLGLSTGPFVGGLITQYLGWRFLFWLNLPLTLMLIAVTVFMLKGEWAEARGTKLDLTGSVLLGASLFLTLYGFSRLPGLWASGFITLGVCGLIGFILFERRTANPVVDIGLFRSNAVFAFSNLAALINYAATFAVGFMLSLYLQNIKGLSAEQAGLVLVSQPAMQSLFSPLAGRLSDRIEPRTVASAGMALTLVGLALLVFLRADSSVAFVVVCLVVLGFGFALFSSPNTNAIMSSVKRKDFGVAGAMVSAMRQVGMMFSMGIVMMILALLLGGRAIDPENQDAFVRAARIAFGVFAALCFGGIFASLARGRMHRDRPVK